MALPQAKMREIVFQMLYSYDTGRTEEQASVALLMRELEISRSNVFQALQRASSIQKHLSEIDAKIAETAKSYAFERIQSVERNILRLAIYELLIEKTLPPKVVISEAIRLSRKFASPESANFVNAVLDTIYKLMLGEVPELDKIEESAREIELQQQLAQQNLKLNEPE